MQTGSTDPTKRLPLNVTLLCRFNDSREFNRWPMRLKPVQKLVCSPSFKLRPGSGGAFGKAVVVNTDVAL